VLEGVSPLNVDVSLDKKRRSVTSAILREKGKEEDAVVQIRTEPPPNKKRDLPPAPDWKAVPTSQRVLKGGEISHRGGEDFPGGATFISKFPREGGVGGEKVRDVTAKKGLLVHKK